MVKIFVGETPLPDALRAALEVEGIALVPEKAPHPSPAGDLAVVSAEAGMTSALRHAVNNPLTAVLGYTELLCRDQSLPEDVRSKLATIREHTLRVRELVQGPEEILDV